MSRARGRLKSKFRWTRKVYGKERGEVGSSKGQLEGQDLANRYATKKKGEVKTK